MISLTIPIDRSGDSDRSRTGGGGGGDEIPPAIDPIIGGLLKRLPKTGDVWPEVDRKLWLQLLEGSFRLIYKDADGETQKKGGLLSRVAANSTE